MPTKMPAKTPTRAAKSSAPKTSAKTTAAKSSAKTSEKSSEKATKSIAKSVAKSPVRTASKATANATGKANLKSARPQPTAKTTASKTADTPKAKAASTKAMATKSASRKTTSTKPTSANPSSAKPASTKPASAVAANRPTPQPAATRTRDEAAALQAFQAAFKQFSRGAFSESRQMFTSLLQKYSGVADVAARARMYLSIAERRLTVEKSQPKDFNELYNRGIIELNRGNLIAARELFERALKLTAADSDTAHAHYALAIINARDGDAPNALIALEKAVTLNPLLRPRAQYDADFAVLRTETGFDVLIHAGRE